MPSFGDISGIGIIGLAILAFFVLAGLKGAGGLILCVLIMTVLAGFLAKG